MSTQDLLGRARSGLRSVVLVATVLAVGAGLFAWKYAAAQGAAASGAGQVEPAEVVVEAVVRAGEHRSMATSIGTVLATRSITLRNELPGTVRQVRLRSGQVVEQGAELVTLDISVEAAELNAQRARAELAETTLARLERMVERRAVSAIELDNARAEQAVARAEMARLEAIIERKRIRAPFRSRVGIADVHAGQFLDAGTLLTTLQGVDDAAHVDFAVGQEVAASLRAGDVVAVFGDGGDAEGPALPARIVAIDARIDPATRNATVRARVERAGGRLTPGASVRVRVPAGAAQAAVYVPASALRKGPAGDHVFVLEAAEPGQTRAHSRTVRAGPVVGDEVVILEGLEAGERVAATGSFKLREGALVSLASVPAAAGTSER